MTAIALTIAGSDSSGGAGIEADLKTFSALGVYGACVITALTAQNTKGVFAIHEVPADFIAAQIDAVFSDLDVGAVKIGMLANAPAIDAVAAGLERHRARNVVLDPVMMASSGERLLSGDAVGRLRQLIGRVCVLTPNLSEAAALLDVPIARDEAAMRVQADQFLVDADGCVRLAAPRIETRNTHGTGCTLASAVAAGLAKGLALGQAAEAAKAYVSAAIAAADRLKIGHGNGPVHHFHDRW